MQSVTRKLLTFCATLVAGTAFQVIPSSCWQFAATGAVVAFDFCAVFNCQGGGFFNFCSPIVFFIDCPT